MTDVLTLGEAMASIRTPQPVRLGGRAWLSVAGSESNVAIGLARLGHTACWLGVVGADEPGSLIRRTLRAEGVDTRYVRTTDRAFTGFVVFDRPAHDVTRVSYHRSGSAGSTLTAEECLAARAATAPRVLHVTGITPALSAGAREAVRAVTRAAHAAGTHVCLDVNYRGLLWSRAEAARTLRELLPWVHTVFASEDELDLLSAAPLPVADLLARGTAEVVVTAGAAGSHAHSPGGTLHQPAVPVTVVDSVGAGDAFVAGYLSGILDGLSPADRLLRAATAGAACVGTNGDWEGLPSREGLDLATHGDGTALR
ncbi:MULTISPECIES: sugar kinase [unclassified Streptomyces]|uniref:sugar kinase n=1 Tax=unclassified Streptomyces TaxID=2593676 RepID=UPI003817BA60